MLLFTRTIPRPAIWGGTLIRDYFQYPWFPDGIGQSWSFSCQEQAGGSNLIEDGPRQGMTLLDLWREEPQLFRSRFDRFPVIISLVAPEDDLSVQIHPNDAMAAKVGYSSGKNEAWYFLEASQGASIVYGQNAKNEQQLRDMVDGERWDELIRYLPVHQDDFVYLPAGIIHALKKGSIVYEIQQATDITYRFYDYKRKDALGNERPLQLNEAISCVDYSLSATDAYPQSKEEKLPGAEVTTLIANDSFCVRRYRINGEQNFRFEKYQLMTCVRGNGLVNDRPIGIGESFLITAGSDLFCKGNFMLMCTCEE